ncbi:unnamed protein product [Durusdinium trenchii]|uniref:Uncharacterized protein n=1 Tax=Durusdinium trenchii TaxID=1381693 RepID=A0ABP0QA76_9DINO
MILDEVFKLGRRLKLVNGYTWLPRITGLWDQESSVQRRGVLRRDTGGTSHHGGPLHP